MAQLVPEVVPRRVVVYRLRLPPLRKLLFRLPASVRLPLVGRLDRDGLTVHARVKEESCGR